MAATVLEPIEDAPESSARAAGLRYVSDREPGFGRRRRGKGVEYAGADSRSAPRAQGQRKGAPGSHITFRFRGKSGKMHEVELTDPRAARVLKRCQELPGQDLFQYVDEDGEVVDIDSDDVNSYLQEVTGDDFTAKDFRTWSG